MSTAVAVHPPAHSSPLRPRDSDAVVTSSPRAPASLAHHQSSMEPAARRSHSASASARRPQHISTPPAVEIHRPAAAPPSRGSRSPHDSQSVYPNGTTPNHKSSPNVPIIKKEHPSSPDMHPNSHASSFSQSRHRPRRLDLSRGKNTHIPAAAATVGARPSGAQASKDSGSLSALHDVATACLSPGFQTHDPSVQQQLVRSMEMKEQQRQIIEARLHGKPGPEKTTLEGGPQTSNVLSNVPATARRKGKPPGLSINAPPAHHFAGEPRVVRTAPLDQTFTGLRPANSLSRQVLDRHPHPGQVAAHGPHAPASGASAVANSLPPISSVLNHGPDSSRSGHASTHGPQSNFSPHYGAPSPGYPPPASAGLPPPPPRSHPQTGPIAEPPSAPPPSRQREFKSAEEAVQSLAGGREELLPKIVHYGGHQPPTPPSPRALGGAGPAPHAQPVRQPEAPRSSSNRRRTREEYERDYDERAADAEGRYPDRRYFGWEEERGRRAGPATAGPHPPPRYAPYAQPKDSPEAVRRKKDEFMALCSRAFDLLHS